MLNLELFPNTLAGADARLPEFPVDRSATFEKLLERYPGNGYGQQCARMAQALFLLRTVSTHECRAFLDIYHPNARKHELTLAGMRIITERGSMRTSRGDVRHIGVYVLRSREPQSVQWEIPLDQESAPRTTDA
ncbi:helix-turn-helix domain-containing protein [Pandoraea sp. NPDC090278]|uniref:helix-turn-helix domain-containing protein n=1 Tax=Pandoraea sp. NPDC090278 TaxID=3364391 RepID=UPI00383A8721